MDTHGKVAFQLSFKPDVDNENDKAGGGEGISYGLLDFKNAFNWQRATRHWHVSRGWRVRGGSPGLLLFLPGLARVLLLSNPTPPATPTPHRAIHAGPVCYGLTGTVTENEMGISTADFLQTLVSMLRGKLARDFIMPLLYGWTQSTGRWEVHRVGYRKFRFSVYQFVYLLAYCCCD